MFKDARSVTAYMFAGRAILTLESRKTGHHLTFKVIKKDDDARSFVYARSNPEVYVYVGMITQDRDFRLTRASKLKDSDLVVRGFRYFYDRILSDIIPDDLIVRHEGTCGKCGRALTHPSSITIGLGPECQKYAQSRMKFDTD